MNFLELPNLSFNKNNATFAVVLDIYVGGTTEPVHFFLFMWVPDQGPEQRESKETVLYPQGVTCPFVL